MRPTASERALYIIDWFLSESLRRAPAHQRTRARVLVGGSFVMLLMMGQLTFFFYHRGGVWWHTALAMLVWGSVLPTLRYGHDRIAGLIVAIYSQLAMLFVVLHHDAEYVTLNPWQGVLIMIALYFVGTGFGAAVAALTVVEAFVIPVLGRHGLLIETPLLLNYGPSPGDTAVAFLSIFALGWLYASARENANLALQETLRTLSESREQYQAIAEGTDAVPFTYDLNERVFHYVGPQAQRVFGWPLERWMEQDFVDRLMPEGDSSRFRNALASSPPGERVQLERSMRTASGQLIAVRIIATLHAEFGARTLVGLMLDITELRRLEGELRQAQKLESVGRLAAGVAHEINTPVQYVSDSLDFLRDAVTDLLTMVKAVRATRQAAVEGRPLAESVAAAERAEEVADLPYLFENIPSAFDRAHEGLKRVATIVRSMKEYAHPDGQEKTTVDLNRAIESTLTIARHEYKHVADVETKFGKLPPVVCFAGEINQAILNLIVNASHALDEAMQANGKRGHIAVETRQEGESVLIRIQDSGPGIPKAIRERIFDPFFTTKPVGKGTGQGLSVARSVIVDKHKGELWFESEVGHGTTFFIRLPIATPAVVSPPKASERVNPVSSIAT